MVTHTPPVEDFAHLLGLSARLPAAGSVEPRGRCGQPISAAELDAAAAVTDEPETAERLREMARVVRAGGTVHEVDEEVAHAQEVGRREIRRRRERRKKARRS